LPSETKEERRLSLRLACSLPLDGARFNIAIPYPGTKLYDIAKEEGRLNIFQDWSNCSNQHYLQASTIPYAPKGTQRAELIKDTLTANLLFNIRPQIIKKILTSPLSGGGVLSLPKKWYLCPRVLFSLFSFFCLVLKRYWSVCLESKLSNLLKIKTDGPYKD
jgi:hypothetical protein